MNKRGISTIVATVLIVLITVAAVTILWAAISPMLEIDASTNCFKAQNALRVDVNKEYTFFNTTSINFRIERMPNDIEVVDLTLYYDINGTTATFNPTTGVPGENGARTYTLGGLTNGATDNIKASVASVVIIDGEETECQATAPVEVRLE